MKPAVRLRWLPLLLAWSHYFGWHRLARWACRRSIPLG
jgi:hypothetical protein